MVRRALRGARASRTTARAPRPAHHGLRTSQPVHHGLRTSQPAHHGPRTAHHGPRITHHGRYPAHHGPCTADRAPRLRRTVRCRAVGRRDAATSTGERSRRSHTEPPCRDRGSRPQYVHSRTHLEPRERLARRAPRCARAPRATARQHDDAVRACWTPRPRPRRPRPRRARAARALSCPVPDAAPRCAGAQHPQQGASRVLTDHSAPYPDPAPHPRQHRPGNAERAALPKEGRPSERERRLTC